MWFVSLARITGFLANEVMGETSPFGLIGNVILGLASGVVGGYLMVLAGSGNTAGGLIATIIAAVIGATVLIWSTRFLKNA